MHDLQTTSFLSALDMNPSPAPAAPGLGMVTSASGSRVSLVGDGADAGPKREVFQDLKRFVSFGLRRDTAPP